MKKLAFKTVVVGVDFSDYSKIVARQAIKIAESLNAKLVFVNALSTATYCSAEAICYMPYYGEFESVATELRKFYDVSSILAKTEVVVEFGRASQILIDVAKKHAGPLIVVGHKSQGRLSHFFLGSDVERLALQSPCPVWIQRGDSVLLPSKILIPCDFSPRTEKSLRVAMRLENGGAHNYEFYHVEPRPVPVLDASTFKKSQREKRAIELKRERDFRSRFPSVVIKSNSGEAAVNIAKESRKFDLITMAPHNRVGRLENFGSVTAKVVRSGNVPVLIAH